MPARFTRKNIIIFTVLVAVFCSLCFSIVYAMTYDGYTVDVKAKTFSYNGTEYKMEQAPFTYGRVTYVPLQSTLTHVDYGFGWDHERGMLTFSENGTTYRVKEESKAVWAGDKELYLSMPVKRIDTEYFVPKEFFTKVLNKKMRVQGRITAKLNDNLVVLGNEKSAYFNSVKIDLKDKGVIYDNELFLPAEAVLQAMSFTTGWQDNAMQANRNGQKIEIPNHTDFMRDGQKEKVQGFVFHNLLYVRASLLQQETGIAIHTEGNVAECPMFKRDLLKDTKPQNAYRLTQPLQQYGGVCVIGTRAMEILRVSQNDAKLYAGVVNAVADALPQEVHVYSMLLPNSAEFYAPQDKAPNQLAAIRTAYGDLSSRVTPINVYQPLADHADEKIYFDTDHHWTQRGAYYAYLAYNDYRGVETPSLDSFETAHTQGFVGSFAGFMSGTPGAAVCKNNPDLLERFLPKVSVSGRAYSDMHLTKSMGKVNAIELSHKGYTTFIGGDKPISKFETSNKNGKSVLIIKESYGNALATFAVNDYQTVYVLDPRKFNGFGGFTERFNLPEFYQKNRFDDVILINYPVGMTSSLRQAILNLVQS